MGDILQALPGKGGTAGTRVPDGLQFGFIIALEVLHDVVVVRLVPGISVREFAAGFETVVVVGVDWFSRIILVLDGFSTFWVDTRLLTGEGVVGLLVGADGVAEVEPPPPPLVLYWAAMFSYRWLKDGADEVME